MRSKSMRVFAVSVALAGIAVYMEAGVSKEKSAEKPVEKPVLKKDSANGALQRGIEWLVSVQGKDGGWGQDGGETSYVRQGERLERSGNDVANTALAAQVLVRAGNTPKNGVYREPLQRAVNFILMSVERSPDEGLAVTDVTGTQIQRKLGPHIDTFLTSKLLADLDGKMGDTQSNARVRRALAKCVAKIEKNQMKDGSWNLSGGWAPILGTSIASQSLAAARAKGVPVAPQTMAMVDRYTKASADAGMGSGRGRGDGGVAGGVPGGVAGGIRGSTSEALTASAGVSLYKSAQELEQLSRTAEDRKKNAKEIDGIKSRLNDSRFVAGFGSIGGEEFFSYLNISDSLRRAGGPEWTKWNTEMKTKLVKLQNGDGTWAGHHCITGRVAVTSAAILLLAVDGEPLSN